MSPLVDSLAAVPTPLRKSGAVLCVSSGIDAAGEKKAREATKQAEKEKDTEIIAKEQPAVYAVLYGTPCVHLCCAQHTHPDLVADDGAWKTADGRQEMIQRLATLKQLTGAVKGIPMDSPLGKVSCRLRVQQSPVSHNQLVVPKGRLRGQILKNSLVYT